MKKILSLLLIINCFAFAMAQNQSPEIHFTWNKQLYPVYQQSINKLVFQLKNCPDAHSVIIEKDIKSISFVSGSVKTSTKSGEYSFEVSLNKSIDVSELKQFFTSIHFTEFYFNTNKVYVSDLLTNDEILAKQAQASQENYPSAGKAVIPASEQKEFDRNSVRAKLNSLYNEDYPKYLFSGNISALKDRLAFLNQSK
jgi:hypothetical protein